MTTGASFENFERELNRLVEIFTRNLALYKTSGYDEQSLRQEFLNPFFAALGWDMENKAGVIPSHREVIVERRTDTGRADYLFQPGRKPRFVCEAKKPAEELPPHARQAKRYAWIIGIRLAMLSDFEETNFYIANGNPDKAAPEAGLWRSYHYTEYGSKARELWDLLSRDNVADGSIEQIVAALPKMLKPVRTKDFDEDFLSFLDGHRRALASDLIRNNDRADLLEGTRLNEAVQCILDRLIFIRICEARGIDTGTKLQSLNETWKGRQPKVAGVREEPPSDWGGAGLAAPRGSLWHRIARHIRALDRRPPSHIPYFNGNLFKPHFSEELVVGDVWLSEFLTSLSEHHSPYKFGYFAIEILCTIYERFLGKIVRPHGRGAVIEEKPEVRKAGGVYYTPRYIVEYIVEQTVGKMLEGKKPEETLALRFLDPACGSGSFLLRVFERVCEHWQQWLLDNPAKRKKDWCWLDAKTNTLHLTIRAKRQILRATVHGVDLDAQAVEVTQLSLYLKMLEGETTETLNREQDLFGSDEAILPPLQDNIKCGNSLIASDFSVIPDDLVRVHAFDWSVQFAPIMKAGGFDAVVGNPPYGMIDDEVAQDYCARTYQCTEGRYDLFEVFFEQAIKLAKRSNGRAMFIVPSPVLTNVYSRKLRQLLLSEGHLAEITNFGMAVFEDPTVHTCILRFEHGKMPEMKTAVRFQVKDATELSGNFDYEVPQSELPQGEHSTFDVFVTPQLRRLCKKLERNAKALNEICYIRQCIKTGDDDTLVSISAKPMAAPWKPSLRGRSIDRYDTREKDLYLKYGSWLARNWQNKTFYEVPKIAVRETGNRITATIDEDERYFLSSLYAVYPKDSKQPVSLKFFLGIINSRLATWFIQLIAFGITEGAFTKIRTNQFGRLPVCVIDFSKPADKTRHDKLVLLVDKLLGLMPMLRAATADSEKATLQNAVTATDQQIDALVYELYGLTPEEIALVEKA